MASLLLAAWLVAVVPQGSHEASAAETKGMPPVGDEVERNYWTWTLLDENGLALGGGGLDRDDVADLRARGFGAVLNYRGELPHEEEWVREAGMEYLFLNDTFVIEDTMPLAHVEAAVAFIEENLAAGRPVYVHCIGGWHRSPVGPVAYYMKTRGWRFEEAWEHVASLRPGIDPWYTEALLAYEAHLFGEETLTLDLWTDRWDVRPDETVELSALVTRHGTPVEGATVTFVHERTGAAANVTSGPDGVAVSTFTAGPRGGMEYVHARAAKDGFLDGYDRNVYWIGKSKTQAPTVLDPLPERLEAAPGETVVLPVRVREADGGAANARVTLTTACRQLHRDYTGWDGKEDVTFRAPDRPGTYEVRAHVNRFPAPPVFATFQLVVGGGGPEPTCSAEEAPPPRGSAGSTTSERVRPMEDEASSPWSGRMVPALMGGAAVAALALAWRRARSHRTQT